jgi:signal peptidase I
MLPTLVPGQRVRVRRSPPAVVSAGDLVLAEMPTENLAVSSAPRPGPGRILKRAVAVPGDRVPPASIPAFVDGNPVLVPPDMFVLLGDNPAGSFDSRQFGYVPAARILGVVANRIPGP